MSTARHHAEWLSLVEVSGPFLSMPVLLKAFPQGLDAHDSNRFRLLRMGYEEWQESAGNGATDPAVHNAWIRFVLEEMLELSDDVLADGQAIPQSLTALVAEHRETLRPDIIVRDPTNGNDQPRVLIKSYPVDQALDKPVKGRAWAASPDTRMMDLLHSTGVQLGLVTNGDRWMLVNAPRNETTGYTSWYAPLWLEEKVTFQSFRSLLNVERFFNVPEEETLESLLTESAANQQEVTDQLGLQVRTAVEILVQTIDRLDQDQDRRLLADVPQEQLYEAALTVMMRLVFLLCAEERGLLALDDEFYSQNYAISTLGAQLRESGDQYSEEILERRHDAWCRLLSTFRVVYGGLQHDRLTLPAYGGHLLDPDRFPFLEGREPGTTWQETPANPLPIDNRTVLHLLEALQFLQLKTPGGGAAEARRLSFRALDIEQIGHVYEGLLDHTAVRAEEPVLGFSGTKGKEPEIPLSELEAARERGQDELVDFLKKETGRSVNALRNALDKELETDQANRLQSACRNDQELWNRVRPFAALVRDDTFGYPVVIPEGSVYVTAGTDRRSSGTHYTPRSLTEPIVQYTLEPLVYEGPAEGKPKEEWTLKSARELLELNICDMACGSGAFLVQACRYMSERLLEAWAAVQLQHPDVPTITPEGEPSKGRPDEQLVPPNETERLAYAQRLVAQRCLYGVDVNPLAVEMAKLSLWLLTLAKDKAFTFLDHSIRCGDSLVGLHEVEQLRYYSLKPETDDDVLFKGLLDDAVDEAVGLRLKLEDMPANTVEDVAAQETLLAEAEEKIARLRCAADMLVSAEFWGENARDKKERLAHAAAVSAEYVQDGSVEEFEEKAEKERRGQKMFHWPLEFSEVIVKRGGFDAFVGNPPFLGGSRVSGIFSDQYLAYLLDDFPATSGNGDLVAFFLRRAHEALHPNGALGLITTNSISQGTTREGSLDYLLDQGATVFRANKSYRWPGTANVFVSIIHLSKAEWTGVCELDGIAAEAITPYLDAGVGHFAPCRLSANLRTVFRGSTISGEGFILTPTERAQLIEQDGSSGEVVRAFLTGRDINQHPLHESDRFAIDLGDLDEAHAKRYAACWSRLYETVRLQRVGNKIKRREQIWWQYIGRQEGLYAAISSSGRVLACGQVSKYWGASWVPTGQVFADKVVVFALDTDAHFAVLNSCFHTEWAEKTSSRLKEDPNYNLAKTFETFPLPTLTVSVERLGREYHSCRQCAMVNRTEGLTDTYNRFHDPSESSPDVHTLRDLHVEVDQAVATAYGWDDLDLDHGFHETKQGVRYTISEPARREVLQRLLKLNHERYEEEVKQGLHDKKKSKRKPSKKKKKAADNEQKLF